MKGHVNCFLLGVSLDSHRTGGMIDGHCSLDVKVIIRQGKDFLFSQPPTHLLFARKCALDES